MVLVGVQPTLMQVPPTCSRSMTAIFQPARASASASGLPDWPVPMMTASYAGSPMLASRGNGCGSRRHPPASRGPKDGAKYNSRMRFLVALSATALCLATAASAQDAAQLVEQAKRRWTESPHGPMLERILPPTFQPDQLPERKSRGARLVAQYCVQCHNLPNPAMHHAAKWPAIFERMVVRMRGSGTTGGLMHEMMAGVEGPALPGGESLPPHLPKLRHRRVGPQK